MPSVPPAVGAPTVLRERPLDVDQAIVDQPVIAPAPAPKLPATVPQQRKRRVSRVTRLAMPFIVAAGVAGAAVGSLGATALAAGWFAATPAAVSQAAIAAKNAQEQHLSAVRSEYQQLSYEAVLSIRKQASAAATAGIGFASEPAPLGKLPFDEEGPFLAYDAEEVARGLANHGRVYVGILGSRESPRGGHHQVVEAPSAKTINSIAELQSFLAKF